MNMYSKIINSTLSIECGDSRGSGFHFIKPELIVTNFHVVEDNIETGEEVKAVTADGDEFTLELVAYSKEDEHDYAIYSTPDKISAERDALSPRINHGLDIGTEVAFSGFPHGILDLLVQRAIISGEVDDKSFYIDGSVNGGNSGGPIVDLSDGSLIGIVTQRRFLGEAGLDKMKEIASQIKDHWDKFGQMGSVQLMGVDFGAFSSSTAESLVVISNVLEENANTGIGIGYSSEFITQACKEHGFL